MRLIRSEWIKVFSTKMWWVLFIAAVALTMLSTLPIVLLAGTTDPSTGQAIPGTDLNDPAVMRSLWAAMGSGSLIALVLGILGFTGEYRHGTISDTFLTEPRRTAVIAAKSVVQALLAALLALLTCAASLAVLVPMLATREHAPVEVGYVAGVAFGVLVTYILYGVLGVAVGALITSQLAAIVIALLWVMLVESLIVTFRPEIGKWLPGGAASGILNAQAYDGSSMLNPWLGGAVLLGYTVLFAAAAALTTLRRDIT